MGAVVYIFLNFENIGKLDFLYFSSVHPHHIVNKSQSQDNLVILPLVITVVIDSIAITLTKIEPKVGKLLYMGP